MSQSEGPTTLGLLAEHASGERRVALIPADVKRLSSRIRITVESGAGANAGFADQAYVEAGASVLPLSEVKNIADVFVKVRGPAGAQGFRPDSVLISLGGRDEALGSALKAQGVTHLGLERIPRITRAQSMDVLSSQASIAGYRAVLLGAAAIDTMLPMMTTAAGIIKPAKMIAIGAGVAGLQALATARRLGAVTFGFDVREAAREQVESLGAKFVSSEGVTSEGSGGYAGKQTADQQAAVRLALAPHLAGMQLIITTAQIPGQKAPVLIDEAMVASLAAGTVIVDLAAESGGNCVHTVADEVVTVNGVQIFGHTTLSSAVATDASRLFSGNIRALLEHLISESGELLLERNDAITAALLYDQSATPVRAVA